MSPARLGRVARRELGLVLRQPGTWLVVAGTLLTAGLFYLLRLAAGEGGDHGGLLRELGAVLLPAGGLLGAAAPSAPARLRVYLRGPFTAGEVALGLALPTMLVAGVLGATTAMLPWVTRADAPVDPGVLLAGGLALALLGAATASMGAAGAALARHQGAGALGAFLAALAMWGAPGLAAATGLGVWTRLDLAAGLLPAGLGWWAPGPGSACVGVALVSLVVLREALEGRRL